jgi:hypothetical protein
MKKIIPIFLLLFSASFLRAQELSSDIKFEKKYQTTINVDKIKDAIDTSTTEFEYHDGILKINSFIRFKTYTISNEKGTIIDRGFLHSNIIQIKLYPKQKYYIQISSEFSSKYFLVNNR